MPHDDERTTGTGVGTDGSLRSVKEPTDRHGADRSGDLSGGVGTDGGLAKPDRARAGDPSDDVGTDGSQYADRDAAAERDTGMD
jgi:hypothetical protein